MSTRFLKNKCIRNPLFISKTEKAESMWCDLSQDVTKTINTDSFEMASDMDMIKYILSYPDKFKSIPKGEKTNCHFVLEDSGSKQAFKDDMGVWDPVFVYNTRSYDMSNGRRVDRSGKGLRYADGSGEPDVRMMCDYKYTFFRHHHSKGYLKKCFVANNYVMFVYTGMIGVKKSDCALKETKKLNFGDLSLQKKSLNLNSEKPSTKFKDSRSLKVSDIIVKMLKSHNSNSFNNSQTKLKKGSYAIYKSKV